MRRPAVPDVSVRAVARRPVGHGVRHRLCHFRDRRRVADEQAHRHDQHDCRAACTRRLPVPSTRPHRTPADATGGRRAVPEPCRICTPPLVGSGGGREGTADRPQPRRPRGGRRRAGARALRPDLLVHPARQGAADGVRRHGRPVRGALRGPLTARRRPSPLRACRRRRPGGARGGAGARASRSSPTPGGASTSSTPGATGSRSSATATSSSSGRTASSESSASRRSRRPRKRGVRSRSAGWPDPGPRPRPCRAPPGACG